jgi:hypothetical protein
MVTGIERLALRHALIEQIGKYISETFADENNQLKDPSITPQTILLAILMFSEQLRSNCRTICDRTGIPDKTYLDELDKAESYAVDKLASSL